MLVVVAVFGAAALQPCSRLPARLPPRPAAGNRRAETGEATRRQARVAQQVRSELAVLIRDGATRVKSTARVDPAVLRATSVVDVTVSPDLRAATATVTTRGDAAQKREAFSWLVANAKGFRYALAQRLRHSKRVPEVTFRKADVGKPKATVAAEFVQKRVAGVKVEAHSCPIQDKEAAWYKQFQVIVMGLDSIEARRWLNAMACSLVEYEADEAGVRKPKLETVIPLVDGGTEGFAGHVRVIYPGVNACFECTLDLFPPQQAVPLCTIAETPRNAAHCILYAHLIEYPKHFPDAKADKDDPQYQQWVYTCLLYTSDAADE